MRWVLKGPEITSQIKIELHIINKRLKLYSQPVVVSCVVEVKVYDNLRLGGEGCHNYLDKMQRFKLGAGEAKAIHKYFMRKQRKISNFFMLWSTEQSPS